MTTVFAIQTQPLLKVHNTHIKETVNFEPFLSGIPELSLFCSLLYSVNNVLQEAIHETLFHTF